MYVVYVQLGFVSVGVNYEEMYLNGGKTPSRYLNQSSSLNLIFKYYDDLHD